MIAERPPGAEVYLSVKRDGNQSDEEMPVPGFPRQPHGDAALHGAAHAGTTLLYVGVQDATRKDHRRCGGGFRIG